MSTRRGRTVGPSVDRVPARDHLQAARRARRRSRRRTSSRSRASTTRRSRSCSASPSSTTRRSPRRARFVARHPRARRARRRHRPGRGASTPRSRSSSGLERVATGEVYVISDSNVRVQPGVPLVARGRARGPARRHGREPLRRHGRAHARRRAREPADLRVDGARPRGRGRREPPAAHGRQVDGRPPARPRARSAASARSATSSPRTTSSAPVPRRRLPHRGRRSTLVENRNVGCTVARTLERHTRWAKMRRALYPAGLRLRAADDARRRRVRAACVAAPGQGDRGGLRGAPASCRRRRRSLAVRAAARARGSAWRYVAPRDRPVATSASSAGRARA